MKTTLLQSHQIDEAVSLLKKGELVALPTETVYGLAGDATNDQAIRKIFISKKRPLNHPLILHVGSLDEVLHLTNHVSDMAKLLAERFWPGPLTMLFYKNSKVSELITGGLQTLAIRIPDHPVMLEVLKKFGRPLVAPSANIYKKISPTNVEHVIKGLAGQIAAIVDGGTCKIGIESTIIDMTKEQPTILRPGVISRSMIEEVTGVSIEAPLIHKEKISGNMEIHYQPDTPLLMLSLSEIQHLLSKKNYHNIAIMHCSELEASQGVALYPMPADQSDYARLMYQTLHNIDKTNAEKILVERPIDNPEWSGIYDRLSKASTKDKSYD